METLSNFSYTILYFLLAVMGLFSLLILRWQILVLKGRAMRNPDNSYDDWHEQKVMYGMAFADILISCPANIIGIILVFITPKWGFYLLALVSFWWVWSNTMTTATSLRFEKPKLTLIWFITYPFGAIVGLAYIVWTIVHFDTIYLN